MVTDSIIQMWIGQRLTSKRLGAIPVFNAINANKSFVRAISRESVNTQSDLRILL